MVPPEEYWVVSMFVTDEPARVAWLYVTAVFPPLLTVTVRVPVSPGINTSGSRLVFVTVSPALVDDPVVAVVVVVVT
jgi:hypothetical protein